MTDDINPMIKHTKWVSPDICGTKNPVASIIIVYMILVLVGIADRLMPILENMAPDIPRMGIGDDMMKDAATVMRYTGMMIFGEKRFLSKQNHRAYELHRRCMMFP